MAGRALKANSQMEERQEDFQVKLPFIYSLTFSSESPVTKKDEIIDTIFYNTNQIDAHRTYKAMECTSRKEN
jgi:hypothetical protein